MQAKYLFDTAGLVTYYVDSMTQQEDMNIDCDNLNKDIGGDDNSRCVDGNISLGQVEGKHSYERNESLDQLEGNDGK